MPWWLAVSDYKFNVFVCVQLSILYTKTLSILLQGSTIDIKTAYEKVKLAHDEIMHVRNNAEDEFHSIIEKATVMAETAGTTISKPRTVKRQTLRRMLMQTHQKFITAELYFLPFVDGIIQQLSDRFPQLTLHAT